MPASDYPSFHYHAEGFAFSGEFVRPFSQKIEVQAGASLPYTGGHGQSVVENFRIGNYVSFRRGYTHVSGSEAADKHHHSHTTAVVEGLNVLDVVTADRVVARLSSDHEPAKHEGHIIAMGSYFENLRISGCPVTVEIDHELLLKQKTIAELTKNVASLKKSGRIADTANGVVICSLAKSIDIKCPGIEVEGHVITVPQFGKIYIGEVLSSQGAKSACMMRLELGSPHHGHMSISSAKINGSHFP